MPEAAAAGDLPVRGEATRLLRQIQEGDREAAERLMPLVYDELLDLLSNQTNILYERMLAETIPKGVEG
mgnify:CR=1 FL=1